ncbi:molybdopterin converting factor subunit 1 [Alphaproteobacteria bacterium]|jgi:sulfur-carrier protein|nr:molybdopterin converting factor subunit 1 [Alphaproteobacteria bacterium]
MKIKYFAWIRELTKSDEEYLDSNQIQNLKELKKFLSTKYPTLQKHFDQEILRFAVNHEYVVENINLDENDEIAVFPPVSGG